MNADYLKEFSEICERLKIHGHSQYPDEHLQRDIVFLRALSDWAVEKAISLEERKSRRIYSRLARGLLLRLKTEIPQA